MDDATLIKRLFARDRRAVLSFYRTHVPALRRFIRTKVSNPEDAEEVLQDALCAFLEGLRNFYGKSSIKTYLYSICRNKIVDYYRRKKMRHLVFSQMPNLEKFISPLFTPEEALDTALVQEKIRNAFARIDPIHRQVLVLKYIEGISVDDIAHKLAITFKSAESRLFRARKSFVETFVNI